MKQWKKIISLLIVFALMSLLAMPAVADRDEQDDPTHTETEETAADASALRVPRAIQSTALVPTE